jgi:ABC-type polar amino acid transport system ATPase subunit
MIMITHEADIAHKISDKIFTLLDGKIVSKELQNQKGVSNEII